MMLYLIIFTFIFEIVASLHSQNNGYKSWKIPLQREKTKCWLKHNPEMDSIQIYGPNGEDLVWQALRRDAAAEAAQEPILASFMHASVLSQASLENSLAFHLSNLLASPAMISTQLQALFLEALNDSQSFRDSLRSDIVAVVARDPAVKSYTDVLLYFKGFHALQTHRVAHWLWGKGRKTLGMSFPFFDCLASLLLQLFRSSVSS